MADKKSGLGRVADDAAGYSGDLLEPIALLVGGASKASVAWAAFRNVWMTKVLGPVGLLSGAALGATIAMVRLGKSLAEVGMKGASNMETLTASFKPLLKGIESAKQRMAELSKFAASTPFELKEVAEANRTLENLTKGALSTAKGMRLVGDAASVSGSGFDEMATLVGRLYDGLQSGRPVGVVAQRLQELGVISGAARNQLEALQEQGKTGNEVWTVAEKEIKRAEGAMKDMSQTLEGLQSNLADNKTAFQTAFSNSYIEGEKAGVKALGDAYEKLTPLARYFGEQLSVVSNLWAKFKASAMQTVGVPLLVNFGKLLGQAAIIAPLAVLATTIAKIGVAMGGLGAGAAGANTAVAGFLKMTSAGMSLWGAIKALITGNTALASSNLAVAGSSVVAGAQTVRSAGAMGALAGGAQMAARGVAWLGRELLKTLGAALINPWVMLAAAVIGAGLAWLHYAETQRKAAAEIKSINDVMREQTALMAQNRSQIKSLADLNAHYAAAVSKLTEAQIELLAVERQLANNPNDGNLQKKRDAIAASVAAKQEEVRVTKGIKVSGLEKGENEDHVADQLARQKAAADAEFGVQLDAAAPEDRARLLEERARETAKRAAEQDANDAANKDDQSYGHQLSSDKEAMRATLEAKKAQLAEQQAAMPGEFNTSAGQGAGTVVANAAFKTATAFVAKLQDEIAAGEATLADLESQTPKTVTGEYAQLQELITLLNDYERAVTEVAAAETDRASRRKEMEEATGDKKDAAAAALQAADVVAQAAQSKRSDIESKAVMATGTFDTAAFVGKKQDATERFNFLQSQGKQARDNSAPQSIEAQVALMQEADRLQQAVLDGRAAEIALMEDGLAKTLALLDLEDERTRAAAERLIAPASQEDTDNAKANTAAERAHVLAAEDLRIAEAEIGIAETLADLDDDSLDKQLKLIALARERLALQKGMTPEAREAAEGQLDAEEKAIRQQYGKRDEAAKLDQQDAANAGKYRGAERAQKEMATERERLAQNKNLTPEERKAAEMGLDTREKEFGRNQGRTAKRALLETSVADSSNREEKLAYAGNQAAAAREKKRRQKDERELKKMSVEDDTEAIADPEKRASVQKEQMDAYDDAAKQDIKNSQDRKGKMQQAQDAYEKYMAMEIARIKLYMRISSSQSRTAADQNRWLQSNADRLKEIGIVVDEQAELDKAQAQEEHAAMNEDKIKYVELVKQHMEDGWGQKDAEKMAKDEVNADQAQRATDQKQEKMDFLLDQIAELEQGGPQAATAVSSMRSIGGGGGAYGAAGMGGDTTAQIKGLVQQIRDLLAEPVPFLQEQPAEKPLAS